MSYETIQKILEEMGLPYAYYEFNGPIEAERYIAYYEDTKETFLADDRVYKWEPHFAIELYTKYKEPETEEKLVELFDKYEVPWAGGETSRIDTEKVFVTIFYC